MGSHPRWWLRLWPITHLEHTAALAKTRLGTLKYCSEVVAGEPYTGKTDVGGGVILYELMSFTSPVLPTDKDDHPVFNVLCERTRSSAQGIV